jgi:predicted  nucleic acid-binding Zn-ribbon protein
MSGAHFWVADDDIVICDDCGVKRFDSHKPCTPENEKRAKEAVEAELRQRAIEDGLISRGSCESQVSVNHSDDLIVVYHGSTTPKLLCGYHAQREGF